MTSQLGEVTSTIINEFVCQAALNLVYAVVSGEK